MDKEAFDSFDEFDTQVRKPIPAKPASQPVIEQKKDVKKKDTETAARPKRRRKKAGSAPITLPDPVPQPDEPTQLHITDTFIPVKE